MNSLYRGLLAGYALVSAIMLLLTLRGSLPQEGVGTTCVLTRRDVVLYRGIAPLSGASLWIENEHRARVGAYCQQLAKSPAYYPSEYHVDKVAGSADEWMKAGYEVMK